MEFREEESQLYAGNLPKVGDSGQVQRAPCDPAIYKSAPRSEDNAEAWSDSEGEEDPEVIAENAGFVAASDSEGDPFEEDSAADSAADGRSPAAPNGHVCDDVGTLRKRGKKGSEY